MKYDISSLLVSLREKEGLTQEALASRLGISRQAVSKWERGITAPDTTNLILLSKIYGVSLDGLFCGYEHVSYDGIPVSDTEEIAPKLPEIEYELTEIAEESPDRVSFDVFEEVVIAEDPVPVLPEIEKEDASIEVSVEEKSGVLSRIFARKK